MTVTCKETLLEKETGNALILGVFKGQEKVELAKCDKINEVCKQALAEFNGKVGETAIIYTHTQLPVERILLVGLGEAEKYDYRILRQSVGSAVNSLKSRKVAKFAVAAETFMSKTMDAEYVAQALVEGSMLAAYSYDRFKEKNEAPFAVEGLTLLYQDADDIDLCNQAAQRGKILADATNFGRDLQNHPGNWLTPTRLADLAKEMAEEVGLSCKVLEKSDMEKLKMGALLGVARGSQEPPKLIILEHNADKDDLDTIVFVGKAITFDSGGISIKPGDKMEEMKFDMSGGAAVVGAMKGVAELDLPFHVVGLVPASENLPSGTSYKPGDILTASSGTTIEVLNTDAEGRLVLADALSYADRYKPKFVIDLATLTGACVIALGHHATGLMGNDQPLIDGLKAAGEKTGERVWPLPLWDDYSDDIKGDYADIKNVGGRAGGAITAAAFLWKFAKKYRWAHLDIAGTAWTTKDQPHMQKGGTGLGVRLLVEFLRDGANS